MVSIKQSCVTLIYLTVQRQTVQNLDPEGNSVSHQNYLNTCSMLQASLEVIVAFTVFAGDGILERGQIELSLKKKKGYNRINILGKKERYDY